MPAADETDDFSVDLSAEKGHSSSCAKRTSTNIRMEEAQLEGIASGNGSAKSTRYPGHPTCILTHEERDVRFSLPRMSDLDRDFSCSSPASVISGQIQKRLD
jgi:hypothetical protein